MSKAGILSVQFNAKVGDKKGNLQKAYDLISQYCDKQLDLVVLPEFFSTGIDDKAFINSPEDRNGGEVIEFMKETAKRFHTNIVCGSVIIEDNGKRYNTAFVIDREGNVVGEYRKIHLFNYFGGNEGTYICPGDRPVVIELDFARVGLSMCFDIKFPMLYKQLIKMGAEIIVSPSAWCGLTSMSDKDKEDFVTTWRAMNICRAAESLVYFVTSNLSGNANDFLYCTGNSMICGPMGEVLQNAGTSDNAVYAEADLALVRNFKGTVPVAMID